MAPITSKFNLGILGPDQNQPCGIADYTDRLNRAIAPLCNLSFLSYSKIQANPEKLDELKSCDAILVHYERSLMPDKGFLRRLGKRFPDKIFVVPHEVYDRDPFAFDYAKIQSSFLPLLWIKQGLYHWRHREYAEEKSLQAHGYWAKAILPLSDSTAEILRPLAGGKVLSSIPLAFEEFKTAHGAVPRTHLGADHRTDLGTEPGPILLSKYFSSNVKSVIGVFGFLNPSHDYGLVLNLMEKLPKDVGLLILGGNRKRDLDSHEQDRLDASIEKRVSEKKLNERIKVTGYIEEKLLPEYLSLCDVFINPMKFKSNSSSLVHLFSLGKAIFVSDLALTRYLKKEGAPLELYSGLEDLFAKVQRVLQDGVTAENQYPWTFSRVAAEYLRVVGGGRV